MPDFNTNFMETNNEKVRNYGKWLLGVLAALAALVTAVFCLESCGSTTRALVRNNSDGNTVTVTVSTNNPTNWEVKPDVTLEEKQK